MKKKQVALLVFILVAMMLFPQKSHIQTFCNPLNISYRFSLTAPSRRTAADPTIVLYKGNYYLFTTQSGGYWYSPNLLTWVFVTTPDLPFELDAPTAAVINGSLYFIPINSHVLYRAIDPIAGKWEKYNDSFPLAVGDPDLFQDTDGRVYFYYGCSNNDYIKGVELDVNNKLNPIGQTANCFKENYLEHGWERAGDYNAKEEKPWIEAPWMTKHNGKYYLQYSAPGTEFKSYSDGVYVSKNPLGPFTYATNNPFSSKPEGFINGAGHGAVFEDKYENWWHISTMIVSVKDKFERRLGLFPVTFDKDDNIIAHTEFGDYPMVMPQRKYSDVSELFPGWMLLSYKKAAEASSSLDSNPTSLAFNEEVRDYWSAKTGNKGEWLSVDLGSKCTINAIQINFAENNTKLFGRIGILAQQYLVEYSLDKITWKVLVDKTNNKEDLTHQYHVISKALKARYLRVTNYRVPSGTFAISDFRVFGTGTANKPAKVSSYIIKRDVDDSRNVKLSWKKPANATGYTIHFGTEKDKLYRSYQVYGDTNLIIRSLDKSKKYWFSIDAFGENGITPGDVR